MLLFFLSQFFAKLVRDSLMILPKWVHPRLHQEAAEIDQMGVRSVVVAKTLKGRQRTVVCGAVGHCNACSFLV
jgi:hypothetical protein